MSFVLFVNTAVKWMNMEQGVAENCIYAQSNSKKKKKTQIWCMAKYESCDSNIVFCICLWDSLKTKKRNSHWHSCLAWMCHLSAHDSNMGAYSDMGGQKTPHNCFKFHWQPRQPITEEAIINLSMCDYRLNMISRWESRLSSIYCQTPLKLCVSKGRFTPFNSVQWEGLPHHIRNFKSPLV